MVEGLVAQLTIGGSNPTWTPFPYAIYEDSELP